MASCRVAATLVLFSATGSIGHTAATESCLSYEPRVVRIAGVLGQKTVPGPPNYESIRNSDRPETYWFMKLSHPVCVDQDKAEPDRNPAEKSISRIQLVPGPAGYAAYAGLLGKRVVATGTLFGAITGHHHTPVLLTVRTVSASNP
jgi:hypothetical protein